MKKIIFVVGNYKNGGVPMRATNLANEFAARGYEVVILVTKEIGSQVYVAQHKNVKIVLLREYVDIHCSERMVLKDIEKQKKNILMYKRIRYFTRQLTFIDKLLEKRLRGIRKNTMLRIFMLNNQNSVVIPFGIEYFEKVFHATKGLKCKVVYAERNAPELEFPKEGIEQKYLFFILKKVSGVIVQTEDEKDFYRKFLGQKVHVIHNPVKKNLPQPFDGKRRKIIVNYCRVAEQKNLRLLIKAFVRLYKEYPDYSLEIYGNVVDKNEELLCEELKKYIFDIKMERNIKVLPPLANIHNQVRDCAMFVSSSDYEGLSNSMIEAMAIGMPCVCTNCLGGGAKEMIADGINGILVPIKDEVALYQGMKKMIENPEFAQKCGKNASEIIEEMSSEKIADKWIEVIENI